MKNIIVLILCIIWFAGGFWFGYDSDHDTPYRTVEKTFSSQAEIDQYFTDLVWVNDDGEPSFPYFTEYKWVNQPFSNEVKVTFTMSNYPEDFTDGIVHYGILARILLTLVIGSALSLITLLTAYSK